MEVWCGISYWMAHKCRVGEETVRPTTGAKVTSQHVNRHCQGTTHQVPPTPTPRLGIRKFPWMHAHQVAALSGQHGDVPQGGEGHVVSTCRIKTRLVRKTAPFPPK